MRYVLPTTPNVCSYTTLAKIVKFQRAQYKGATTVLKLGGSERRRRRGCGVWGGGAPLPLGKGLGRGPCSLPRICFDFFYLKW